MNDIDTAEYGIAVNQSLQYSRWPTHLKLPSGYKFAVAIEERVQLESTQRLCPHHARTKKCN